VWALGLVVTHLVQDHHGARAAVHDVGAPDIGGADDVFQREVAAVPTGLGSPVAPFLVGELAMAGIASQVPGGALQKLDLLKRMQRTSD
jgi:hypothetical protein